ncbi:MAG TPA: alpha/beta hydrolase, partial [Acidimicrobiales bacterium]|nr:alpha/beta hydrolase [Acidimicrobiales bacterium]
LGVVACCAMTDMRWEGARCTMSRPHWHAVWDAPGARLADGGGWVTFDVTTITCPVTVLHGEMDNMCNVVNARNTAEIVPNARLVLYDDLGHFSIVTNLIPTISDLLTR